MDDIQQMLCATPHQDAFLQLKVETDRPLKQCSISRYEADIVLSSQDGNFAVYREERDSRSVEPVGVLLSDPSAAPLTISPCLSEDVETGVFEIPEKMHREGPWLIVPTPDSGVLFRPKLWIPAEMESAPRGAAIEAPSTLHSAARMYHPENNPEVIDRVIQQMAEEYAHSGWDYLLALKQNFAYLPLSVFETWRALAGNGAALALAAFRLELDDALCRRFSNELSVIWESIRIDDWKRALDQYRSYMTGTVGISESITSDLAKQSLSRLGSVIPVFKHLPDTVLREASPQPALPVSVVMPGWYQDLRRRHAEDDHWPDMLSAELRAWVEKMDIPGVNCVNIGYTHAVVYLPVFMAYLAAGNGKLSDLQGSDSTIRVAARVLADFDREGWFEPVYSLYLANLLQETI